MLLPFFLLLISSQKTTVGITSYVAKLNKTEVSIHWKDKNGNRIATLGNLKKRLESNRKKVLCMMNAGMFTKDFSPQGYFVENGKTIFPADGNEGTGNFYLKPNGVFGIEQDGRAFVCATEDYMEFKPRFATQSGPMLVIDGKIHAGFTQGSPNLNVRNGVGILPDGSILFAISDAPVNFYDFALFFRNAGCKNALYLDGFVSKAYIPGSKHLNLDGNFGPIISVVAKR